MIVLDNNHNYSANFKRLCKLLGCVIQKIYVILCFGTPAIPPTNVKWIYMAVSEPTELKILLYRFFMDWNTSQGSSHVFVTKVYF